MYSALGSESAFRDGLFSQAAPGQGFQHSVREFGDGSLGQAYRDGSLGATTRLLRPVRAPLMTRLLQPFQSVRGLGALPGGAMAPQLPVPLSVLQRKGLLAAVRRTQTAKARAVRGYGAEDATPMMATASVGPNWPLIIGGGAAIAVAAVVMLSGKKRR